MLGNKTGKNKRLVAVSAMLCTSLLAVTVYASTGFKQVQAAVDDQPVFAAYQTDASVGSLLVGKLTEGNDILQADSAADLGDVKKAMRIYIDDAGQKREIYTTASTVGDLIADGVIVLDETMDFMNMNSYDPIEADMTITITRVTTETVIEDTEIAFETEQRANNSMMEGETRVAQAGVLGNHRKVTVTVFHNGKEVEQQVSEAVTRAPVNEIVEYGTRPYAVTASGQKLSYSKVITANATAYCPCSSCCGISTGITATGTRAKYGTVAVDPRVIPLGSRLYIETPDGGFVYGYSVAEDTGGAIKGNRVDLFYPSHSEALRFGRRNVKVYILD